MNRLLLSIFVLSQGFCAFGATEWTGSVSTVWNLAGNWDNGVPDAADDVTIPSGLTNYPIITSGISAITRKITIDGELTINSGGTLSASGDVIVGNADKDAVLNNSGTITTTGKVEIKGTGVCCQDPLEGPFINNYGTISSIKFKVGNNDGGGLLTNFSGGEINVSGAGVEDFHVDAVIENCGIINVPNGGITFHGGILREINDGCRGIINAKLFDFSNGKGAGGAVGGGASQISNQSFYGAGGACTGGAESPTPQYTMDDVTYGTGSFEDLLVTVAAGSREFDFMGGVSSCNEFGASILPVELLYFEGASNKGLVELSWSTASEINNDHFEIESSKNGISFTKIGEIKGNGTTNEVVKYSFVDGNPLGFENYYRLKQVDYDGQFEIFNTIMVLSTGSSNIKIYPNPTSANSKLVVQVDNSLEPDLVSVELSDLSGRILQKRLGYDGSFEFSTAHLTKGTYLVRVSMNRIVRTSKILVD